MPVDSVEYFVLLLGTFVLYHAAWREVRLQNLVLLIASYICYGWLNWTWAVMLATFTVINYGSGRLLFVTQERTARRRCLIAVIACDLGVLGVYKYFNFFADNVATALSALGLHVDPVILALALPIGISFHVFQAIAYQVDVYRRQTRPVTDFITFATFIVFFPQLSAGPIERAEHLARQLERPRVLTPQMVQQGVWLIIWGLFQKVVVADSMSPLVTAMFDRDAGNAASLVVGAVAFAVEIYCDFNAYSMIAKGSAALLGIELVWNFRYPYFATSIQDFWRRWHISLSSWLRDYLYFPLGGSRRGPVRTYVNLMATMGLAGLWHGAAWHYVVWGLWHGGALSVERFLRNRGIGPGIPTPIAWLTTMCIVLLGWVLFRIKSMSSLLLIDRFAWTSDHSWMLITCVVMFVPVLIVESLEQACQDRTAVFRLNSGLRAIAMGSAAVLVVTMYGLYRTQFIYFQF